MPDKLVRMYKGVRFEVHTSVTVECDSSDKKIPTGRCFVMLSGKWLPIFWRSVVPPSFGSSSYESFIGLLDPDGGGTAHL